MKLVDKILITTGFNKIDSFILSEIIVIINYMI